MGAELIVPGDGGSDFASITGWPGSSSQFVHADGSYSPLSAAEIVTALATLTATAGQVLRFTGGPGLAVATLGISDISGLTAALAGKLATPTGTPNGSKFLRDDNSWQTVSATDSTKLPTDGSGSMTAAVIWTAAGTANSANYEELRVTAGIVRNVPSTKTIQDRVAGVNYQSLGPDGTYDWHIGRVDSSAYGRIFVTSADQKIFLDTPSGQFINLRVATAEKLLVGGSYIDARVAVLFNANVPRYATTLGQLHNNNNTNNICAESHSAGYASLSAGDASAASTPVVKVHGLSEGAAAGCLTIRSPGVTYPNDGAWYGFYSLAAGTHTGTFRVYSALFKGHVEISISGTSLTIEADKWGGSFADLTAASGKIAFRVSGGYLQINVGTGISSTPRKFWCKYEGCVQ